MSDAAAPPPSEPEGFPLHAMRMKDFLALDKLRPHNALKKEGLVVALDFDGAHKDAKLNFVSHQWLAYAEADPNGDHLKTMQDVFRRVMAGESIFRSKTTGRPTRREPAKKTRGGARSRTRGPSRPTSSGRASRTAGCGSV